LNQNLKIQQNLWLITAEEEMTKREYVVLSMLFEHSTCFINLSFGQKNGICGKTLNKYSVFESDVVDIS